ncbi:MAG: hypothetical protein LDL33_04790 [Desulfomonile sp.]|nr:hypothetical protein [Desulfomonile sp.]
MSVRIPLIVLVILILGSSFADASGIFPLYAYDPMNAVAADPDPPYNFDAIPKFSRNWVLPCPDCVPTSGLVPDLQPMQEAFRAKQGRPVPVP